MSRRIILMPVALAAALSVAACSSAASPAPGATAAPGASRPAGATPAIPSIAIPSIAIPSGLPSFAIPSGLPSFAIPSFDLGSDQTLADAFPKTINGQPVTVNTGLFMKVLTAFGADEETIAQFKAACQVAGVDPNAVSYGAGSFQFGDEPVQLQAIRAPGGDSTRFLAAIAQLAAAEPGATAIALTGATVGGKSVQMTSDDPPDIYYPHGDIVWYVSEAPEGADAIFAALP